MELPIVPTYDEKLMSLRDQNLMERIRILDIDGTYLVSVWVIEKTTNIFKTFSELAFSTLWEAEEYLRDALSIDLPGDEEKEKDWCDYDAD